MAATVARSPGSVSRTKFMQLGVLTVGGLAIAVTYVAIIGRYLYPKSSGTPPLTVSLSEAGVVDPNTKQTLPFVNGVAGPFSYPTVANGSVVEGMFVEKIDAERAYRRRRTFAPWSRPAPASVAPWPGLPPTTALNARAMAVNSTRDLSVYHGPAENPLWHHNFTLAADGSSIIIKGRA